MARKNRNDDDNLMLEEDELTAAFLGDDDDMVVEEQTTDVQNQTPQDEWDDDDVLPGQLAVDVYETREKLIVKARVAGVNRDELDVSISDNQLTISGTLNAGVEEDVENYFLQECYWGIFQRTIALPVPVKEDGIDATLKDGVLTITFTKVKQDTVKKIEVL